MDTEDPFGVKLIVPILLEEKKCGTCDSRFECWTSRERTARLVGYNVEQSQDRYAKFKATFDLSIGCTSLDLLKERANKPNFVSFEGRESHTEKYDIEYSMEGGIYITVEGYLI